MDDHGAPSPRPARHSRRDLLRYSGLAAASTLAGCAIEGRTIEPVSPERYWAGRSRNGHLRFANWPLYMDPQRTPLTLFRQRTGITVDYDETIQDNASWFGRIRPLLAEGVDIGADLMVITNGLEFNRLKALGHLAPLDHELLSTYAQYGADRYKHTSYDPGNRFSVPYASGITGIAYHPDLVGREITSFDDLWDPAFAGRVGMLGSPQEIANVALLRNGVAPADSTPTDWENAAKALTRQRDRGIVRAYYQQDYIQPLTSGELWLSMAWSGDVFQQNTVEGANLRFVIPREGATIWTDNMVIPITAKNPVDAITLMDFLYTPEVAAELAEYITYVAPVPQAQRVVEERARAASAERRRSLQRLAQSPLVFPTERDYAQLHNYVPLPAGESQRFTSLFLAVTQA
ncbi:ABC transporter substrate-binding protein [Salinactinospora qingdaonensis]|uniref:Spermidine/putrescine ABC transporter substrate-binding protein n=1 Tax=Salinactinospora qingdaonensis TaxID=702744 RepID=A0ABP7FZ00_9ACTN